jgi:hypothetical protein
MTQYKVVAAAHRVSDVIAAGKAAKHPQRGGHIFTPTHFETEINRLASQGWIVVSSNATTYLSDGVALYALLRKD